MILLPHGNLRIFFGICWNVTDYFPLVRPLDLQGLRRRNKGHFCKMLGIFERLRDDSGDRDDVLITLLKLVKENEITLDDVQQMLVVSMSYYKFLQVLSCN